VVIVGQGLQEPLRLAVIDGHALAPAAFGMRARRSASGVAIAVATALAATSCRPKVTSLVEVPRTTSAEQVAELTPTPHLRSLVEELSREGAKGAVEGLLDEKTRGLTAEVTKALEAQIASSLVALQPQMRELAAAVASSAVRSLGQELPRSLGPPIRRLLIDELLRRPDVQEALAEAGHGLGRAAVLGSNEALTGLAARKEQGATTPLGSAADLVSRWTWLIVIGFFVALGLPTALLLRERVAARRDRDRVERRLEVVTALLKAAETGEDTTLRKLLAQVAAELDPLSPSSP
jgi:hypothetical protein